MKSPTVVYFVIALLLCACQNNPAVDNALVQADELMLSRPDSALTLLRSINAGTISGHERQARYALLLSQAYDKNYIDVRNDSLISIAYKFYNRSNNKDVERQAMSCYYFGLVQLNVGYLEKATTSFLDAIKYGRQAGDHYLLGLSNTQLAMIYEGQNLFPQTIERYEEAFVEYSNADLPQHKIQSLIYLGNAHRLAGNPEQGLEYYGQANDQALAISDTLFLMQIGKNISSTLYQQEHIEDAKKTLLSTYRQYNRGNVPDFYSDLFLLGAIYTKEGNADSARYYFHRALRDDNIHNVAAIEYELHLLETAENDHPKALAHLQNHYTLADSINSANQQNNLLEIEKKYETTQLEYANFRQRMAKRQIIISGIILWGIVAVGVLLLHRRHRALISNRDEQIKNHLIALSEADNSMNSILDSKNEKERRLKEVLEKRLDVLSKYYGIAYSWQMKPETLQTKMTELLSLESIEHETFSILRSVIEERHSGLISTITKEHPVLSDNDINFLCLILCRFTSQQMCVVYGLKSLQNVYTKKNRLAMKLRLSHGETIESFLSKYGRGNS